MNYLYVFFCIIALVAFEEDKQFIAKRKETIKPRVIPPFKYEHGE